tara:strand:+ start:27154 stop:28131 length:978 start_codon:yes stop_codon:yes gene_type:complete
MATASKLDDKTVLEMYKTMLTIRRFEEQARREADAGKLRGMHSAIGQEAVPTGICVHLRDGDYIFGTHRSHHHCIAKGLDIKLMMAELLGKATGTNKGKGGTMHIADINKGMLGANGIVGSNIPVATGAALTAQVKGTDLVSIVFFGDGAANQGVLHESMNLAGIWNLPVIFVCENNRYAQSTPFEYSVSGESVADRAAGYGMPGITVDGQSVLDVYEVAGESINRARSGGGPTLIEAKTYRYMGHFGADNPLMYRTQEEEEEFKARDCNQHLMNYILDHNIATQENLDELDQKVIGEVEGAAKFANDSPYPEPSELTTDVYVSY